MIVDRVHEFLADQARQAPPSLAAEVARRVERATARQFCEAPREFQRGDWKRLSNAGKCPRRLFYQATGEKAEPLRPRTRLIFWFGDTLEQAVIGLARAAGCDIGQEQAEVAVDGVKGHIDGLLRHQGAYYVVEVKTMSDYSFEAAERSGVDDTWGYLSQAYAYAVAIGADGVVFVLVKKSTGHLHEQVVMAGEVGMASLKGSLARFAVVDVALAAGSPPERPYSPEPIMTGRAPNKRPTGEEKLGVVCSYCPYKAPCQGPLGFTLSIESDKPVWKRAGGA